MDEKSVPSHEGGTPVIIITGLSGAGKSTCMRFLEDLGRYCLDNLPPALIPDFVSLYERSGSEGNGVVIASDVRSGTLFDDFSDMVRSLKDSVESFEILYLDCDTDTLVKRYQGVRRSHPLQDKQSIVQAIDDERKRLEPIREVATRIIDTSGMQPANLREALIRALVGETTSDVLTLNFVSFGFKYGAPRDADFIFDVRFLPNPFYVEELKAKTGLDDDVYAYVMSKPLADPYAEQVAALIDLTLESFVKVGKTTLNVGIGCTGGRHRSVSFARRLAKKFTEAGKQSQAVHRDVAKPQGA